ncbi:hypothetical protein F7725_028121 [Dissostichus mawsoni]|uniref:Uncharacterized protein n=1 Tax=Dissostichus mawsoni TaxID=36200 RepID=A0A7J5XFC6_DISMA|nr:hypothetical protein F7725_028121 [Dissostichus mawsoni]
MRIAQEQDPENLYLAAHYLDQRAMRGERIEDEARELATKVLRSPVSSYSGLKPLLWEALKNHPDERYLKRRAALCYEGRLIFSDSPPKKSMITEQSSPSGGKAAQIYQELLKDLELEKNKCFQLLCKYYISKNQDRKIIKVLENIRDKGQNVRRNKEQYPVNRKWYPNSNLVTAVDGSSRASWCSAAQTLVSRLEALQCHFTWDLGLSRSSLLHYIGTENGKRWLGHTYNLRGFIQYRLDFSEDSQSFFNKATEAFNKMRNAGEGPWLVVNYGNLAWLHHHLGDQAESEAYLSKVERCSRTWWSGTAGMS